MSLFSKAKKVSSEHAGLGGTLTSEPHGGVAVADRETVCTDTTFMWTRVMHFQLLIWLVVVAFGGGGPIALAWWDTFSMQFSWASAGHALRLSLPGENESM